ncbi:hypothetical protein [Flavobacterium sp.]|uniref:hypothetical protein n=1 Tax=Flavobacterium sp. TaxID=239 RepID=UPI0028BF1469|nr:hypothetical protein [Flavobacterium sp.]
MEELGKRDELSEITNLIETFEKVLEWLEKLGIRTDIGRIAAYRQYFSELIDVPKNETILTIHRANISRELFELVWIYQNFLDYDSEKIINHVKKTLKGVVAINLEKANDQSSRNYLFELRAASYFIKAGYKIDLDSDCDLIAYNDKEKIYVECKRLSSKDKITERIKEASKQLDKRLSQDSSKNTYGIIWIDLSFVQMNYTGFYSAYFRRTCQFAARTDLMILTSQNIPNIDFNKRIIGLVSQTLYPGISEIPKGYYTGSTISLKPLNKSFFKRRKFKNIMDNLLKNFG